MISENGQCMTYAPIAIDVDVQHVLAAMPHSGNADALREEVAVIVDTARRIWSPAMVLRGMPILQRSSGLVSLPDDRGKADIQLRMGYAATFLRPANAVILGSYTIGGELEQAAAKAAARKDYLESYVYEAVARAALSRLGAAVGQLVEEEAASRGWRVGPLLSPGSVHGWELAAQKQLCQLLDLTSAGIRCSDNGVLTPFNSLSFIIGMGPDYEQTKVGSACEVCSRRENCEMRSGKQLYTW